MTRTPLADDLITATLACPCDTREGPLCAHCECLLALIQCIDLWQAEQIARMTGLALPPLPMGRLGRLGYTVLACGVVAVCLLYYVWEMSMLQSVLRRKRRSFSLASCQTSSEEDDREDPQA